MILAEDLDVLEVLRSVHRAMVALRGLSTDPNRELLAEGYAGISRVLARVEEDLRHEALRREALRRAVDTCLAYFGGGTPSEGEVLKVARAVLQFPTIQGLVGEAELLRGLAERHQARPAKEASS